MITRQLEEEGVERSNTTEARLIDRTAFHHLCLMATNQERAAWHQTGIATVLRLRRTREIQPLLADLHCDM
jgi:hypothetical protein